MISKWTAIFLLFLEMAYLFQFSNFNALKPELAYYHSKRMEYTLDYRTQKIVPVEKPIEL